MKTKASGDILSRKPWLLVVAAFIILIGAWAAFYWIATTNKPEVIDPTAPAQK